MPSDPSEPKPHIIRGQRISPDKLTFARDLRKQMTPAERHLWTALRRLRPDGFIFRRQPLIGGYVVDFYCDKARLVVEVDGPIHDRQKSDDSERSRALEEWRVRIVRFRNEEVLNDVEAVVAKIVAEAKKTSPPDPLSHRRGGT